MQAEEYYIIPFQYEGPVCVQNIQIYWYYEGDPQLWISFVPDDLLD